jgi:hypothetical protein
MALLEQFTPGSRVRGILVNDIAVVVSSRWFGSGAVEVTYKDSHGVAHSNIFYRDQEQTLEVVDGGRAWSFDGDGMALRLAYEANRIRLAHLFDPMLAVHTSLVRPLPHPDHPGRAGPQEHPGPRQVAILHERGCRSQTVMSTVPELPLMLIGPAAAAAEAVEVPVWPPSTILMVPVLPVMLMVSAPAAAVAPPPWP